MKKYLISLFCLSSLFGCGEDETSIVITPVPIDEVDESIIDVPVSNCTQFVRNGVVFPIITEVMTNGTLVVETTGFKDSPNSDNITLHNSCGSAFRHKDIDGNLWNEAWLIDGEYYRSDDLPSYVSYQAIGKRFFLRSEMWLAGQIYSERTSGQANKISYQIVNGKAEIKEREWVISGLVDVLNGNASNLQYHRDRSEGYALEDLSFFHTKNKITKYQWIEVGMLIKEKFTYDESGIKTCRYFNDGREDIYDDGCQNEAEFDNDYGIKSTQE